LNSKIVLSGFPVLASQTTIIESYPLSAVIMTSMAAQYAVAVILLHLYLFYYMSLQQSLGVVFIIIYHSSVRRCEHNLFTVFSCYVLNPVHQLVVESHCPFQILLFKHLPVNYSYSLLEILSHLYCYSYFIVTFLLYLNLPL